ncbi:MULTISPECIES: DUF4199 domain-containing protein [Acinetobacter]|uniref:DUF4199 domain-containing protein n=1 Tax=Acinetobacter rongchengensis TaxID=2419601 RepID=A0A3A8FB25_9GAMM|nr:MULTISPECIES: DUF4199 domain-containing protein [Acinetobacter]RKG37903.1 DUF4199 domain-containing protein [Acinetobacter rongchengensis]
MSNEQNSSNKLSPEKSFWGWKLLIIAIILGFLFMVVFYLAITNEPDYMPSQKNKQMQHTEAQMPAMQHDEHMQMQQTASEATASHHHQ